MLLLPLSKVVHALPALGEDSKSLDKVSIVEMASSGMLNSWVLCAAFVDHSACWSTEEEGRGINAMIVVGKSDNTIEILCLSPRSNDVLVGGNSLGPDRPLSADCVGDAQNPWRLKRLAAVECTSRLFLYSMAIMVRRRPLRSTVEEVNSGNLEIRVASGMAELKKA